MKIRYVLLHAYGLGRTIRTVVDHANAMAAARHDVEIVSVVRRRDEPHFAIDPKVRLSTLVAQRDGYVQTRWRARRGAGHTGSSCRWTSSPPDTSPIESSAPSSTTSPH